MPCLSLAAAISPRSLQIPNCRSPARVRRVALSSNTTISGTLSGLSQNHGTLALADGASLATTTALTNGGTLYLDLFIAGSDFSDDGGSTLTIGGVLTNSSQIDIGNSRNSRQRRSPQPVFPTPARSLLPAVPPNRYCTAPPRPRQLGLEPLLCRAMHCWSSPAAGLPGSRAAQAFRSAAPTRWWR